MKWRCSFALLAFALAAQITDEITFRVTTGNVLVDTVVTDKKGQPALGLTAADFEVVQDGKRREVKSAHFVSLPLRLGLGPQVHTPQAQLIKPF